MRVLLDTHMMLWALTDSPRLSARARAVLADDENECWVSSASVWELAIKVMLGKYELGQPLDRLGEAIEEAGFRTLDVTIRHAAAIERVAVPHSDPFDRLLLAQARIEGLTLVTHGPLIRSYPGVAFWPA